MTGVASDTAAQQFVPGASRFAGPLMIQGVNGRGMKLSL